MSKEFKSEQKERTRKIELKISTPPDKNPMIGFDGKTDKECRAYNWAIESVLKKAGLNPFHQVGTTLSGQHEPRYHAWEVWKKATKEDLETLLPQIEQEAQETLKLFKKHN